MMEGLVDSSVVLESSVVVFACSSRLSSAGRRSDPGIEMIRDAREQGFVN